MTDNTEAHVQGFATSAPHEHGYHMFDKPSNGCAPKSPRGRCGNLSQGDESGDDPYTEFLEVWIAETPSYETIEPTQWPPLVQPTEVEIFQPRILVLQA